MDRWFDSHCHLDREPLASHLEDILARARKVGVANFLVPGVDGPVHLPGKPPGLFTAWGFHPDFCPNLTPEKILEAWERRPCTPVAIGECGLDERSTVPLETQCAAFITQLDIARREGLPVLLHIRGRWGTAIEILENQGKDLRLVFHSFGGSLGTARRFLDREAWFSFSGALCRPGAKKAPEVARRIPRDRILLETDSPDQAPMFHQGQFNEPSVLPKIAQFLAGLLRIPLPELASRVWENSRRAFPFL